MEQKKLSDREILIHEIGKIMERLSTENIERLYRIVLIWVENEMA